MRLNNYEYYCRQWWTRYLCFRISVLNPTASGFNQRLVSTFWSQCRNAFVDVCVCWNVCMYACTFNKYIVSTHTQNYPFKQTARLKDATRRRQFKCQHCDVGKATAMAPRHIHTFAHVWVLKERMTQLYFFKWHAFYVNIYTYIYVGRALSAMCKVM